MLTASVAFQGTVGIEDYSPGSVGALCRASLFPGGLEAVAHGLENHGWYHIREGVTSEDRMWKTDGHNIWWGCRFTGIYRAA
jgi:hypothetical protein